MADITGIADLPEHDCWTLLRSAEVGRLAVCGAEGPDIYPINFVVDHGTIVFRTAEGSKLAATLSAPDVAFETDGFDPAANDAWSVVVKGRAEVVTRVHEQIETMELPLFPWHASPKPYFIRIVPGVVSGRRFQVVESNAWESPTSGVRPSATE